MNDLINKKTHSLTTCCAQLMLLVAPVSALAADDIAQKAINTDPMSGNYLFQLILGLIVVLICIVVLAWLAKRMNRLQSSTAGILKIIGGISMGSREKVVLLQVGSEQILLGVSPGRINTLYKLETPVQTPENDRDNSFASSLSEKLNTILAEKK